MVLLRRFARGAHDRIGLDRWILLIHEDRIDDVARAQEEASSTGRREGNLRRRAQEMGVGFLILKARAAAGLSQAQLAKKIGTSQPMIARWESGHQLPSVRSLLRIAEACGFDLALGLHERGADDGELQILIWARMDGRRRNANAPRSVSRTKRRSV